MLEFKSDIGSITIKAGSFILKRKSPLFSNESIEGDIILPSAIPMTPALRAWLNHPDRPEAVYKRVSKQIQLFRNGTPIILGDLLLGDADDESIETTLVCGSSPFAALIKNLFLDELSLGFQSFANESDLIAYWNGSFSGNVYTHPYYLPTIISEETGYLNYFWQSQNSYLLEVNSEKTYMAPMLYYAWLLPQIFQSLGYEFEDLVFIKNESLREGLFFSMHNVNSQEDPLTIHYADLLPHYKLSTWLIDIQNAFGVKFFFDSSKQKVKLDWQVSAISNLPRAIKFPHKKTKVKNLDSRPSFFSYRLNNFETFFPIQDNRLNSIWEPKDLPSPSTFPNKYVYVALENKSYSSAYDSATDSYIFFSITEGVQGGELDFTIGEKSDNALNISSNIYPISKLYFWNETPKNRVYLEADKKTIPPIILFAKHSQNGDFAEAFSFTENFSLDPRKNTWLLQNKLLPWWEFLKNSKPIEDTILLSDVQLANWDWTIPVQIGNVPCLVDEMDITLSAKSELMEVKILAYTM
ncbi:MAG: hypothetical protein JXR34_11930 [Bacteroidales bacterium]|nr:hypothetical protein [Bacteroidales bacterium]